MQNRKRLTNILIAGTVTVLLLTVFLAFRGKDTAETIEPCLTVYRVLMAVNGRKAPIPQHA